MDIIKMIEDREIKTQPPALQVGDSVKVTSRSAKARRIASRCSTAW